MKEIPLTKGHVALVDDEDFEWLSRFPWYFLNKGYAARNSTPDENGKRSQVLMHRVIMNAPHGMEVDHIDGNKLHNTKSNLRLCTKAENCRNQKASSYHKKTSKYKGVSLNKYTGKWYARIRFNWEQIHIGTYDSEIQAALAYNEKAKEIHGEFAKLNDIDWSDAS